MTGELVLDCPNDIGNLGTIYNPEEKITRQCNWGFTESSPQTVRQCLPKNRCYTLLAGVKDAYAHVISAIVEASYDGKQVAMIKHLQFEAIDFGSECEVASCPDDDASKLEIFLFTEEGECHPESYVSDYVPGPNPNFEWSLRNTSDTLLTGVLEKPPQSEGKSYLHYHRECIKRSSCFEFQVESLYKEKEGDDWWFEQISHRVTVEGVVYSEGDLTFDSMNDYPSQYSSLLGECTANTCGAGESLFDVSIISGSTPHWEYEEVSAYESPMAYFYDENKSIESGKESMDYSLMVPDGMDYTSFIMFKLEGTRLPSTNYRYLRCVQTLDACVGLASPGYSDLISAESDAIIAELSVAVNNVPIGDFIIGGPCKADVSGDCNDHYTTEAVGGSCKDDDLSAGAIAGITIGCFVFVATLIAGVVLYRRKKEDAPADEVNDELANEENDEPTNEGNDEPANENV